MCERSNTRRLSVFIPAQYSYTGKDRWDEKPIDGCIAEIVEALNKAGVYTLASCCGHGARRGSIVLLDGRELIVQKFEPRGKDGLKWTEEGGLSAGWSPDQPIADRDDLERTIQAIRERLVAVDWTLVIWAAIRNTDVRRKVSLHDLRAYHRAVRMEIESVIHDTLNREL